MNIRKVINITVSRPAMEGAGVRLHRAFGFGDTKATDPFLLLDDFRGDRPGDYMSGFPWHPHRGIETITYMLEGEVEHSDSIGNSGVIGAGDVQWMTAGSGIIHQEMPKESKNGRMGGFQLWANLPAKNKMSAPKYRGLTSKNIPSVKDDSGEVKIICGEYKGVKGPVRDIAIEPEYFDVKLKAGGKFEHLVADRHNCFAYIYGGEASFGGEKADNRSLVYFGDTGTLSVVAGEEGASFILISGKPLKEPVAWYGPIVMNTEEELETAFKEYENGTFIKKQ